MMALLAGCRAKNTWIDRLRDTMLLGYTDCMTLLIRDPRLDVNNKDLDGRTPLIHAVQNSHQQVTEMLIDTKSVWVKITVVLRFDFTNGQGFTGNWKRFIATRLMKRSR